jgi:hypothetical protein
MSAYAFGMSSNLCTQLVTFFRNALKVLLKLLLKGFIYFETWHPFNSPLFLIPLYIFG